MSEFDYKTAHDKWALPAFKNLTHDIHCLYRDVEKDYAGIKQNKDLSLTWLPGFKEKFMAIPLMDLAEAGNIVWCCGHWDYPEASTRPCCYTTGTYWKFAKLAAQCIWEQGYLYEEMGNLDWLMKDENLKLEKNPDFKWFRTLHHIATFPPGTPVFVKELRYIIANGNINTRPTYVCGLPDGTHMGFAQCELESIPEKVVVATVSKQEVVITVPKNTECTIRVINN